VTGISDKALGNRSRAAGVIVVAAPLLLGLPLLGLAVSGRALEPYFDLPPLTRYVEHAGFSWFTFLLIGSLTVVAASPFLFAVFGARVVRAQGRTPGRFPIWGWGGVALTLVGWGLAWTRVPGLAPVQPFTFLPLWVGYIAIVNALVAWRTGRCPLTDDPMRYGALFPLSAVFWWFFEYLNRFVQNWYYVGIEDFGELEYVAWSSLAFATVLPAVGATQAFLMSFPRLHSGLERAVVVDLARSRGAALATLIAASLGLYSIGLWPDFTYPMLWLAPLGILIGLQSLFGLQHAFVPVVRGDWRGVWTWALAALVCGVFWETWNFYSQAKWVYAVPFVHRWEVFEMPLLGYAGYLPFGLECAAATLLAAQLTGHSETEETAPSS
jgi:hypothetical protein